MRFGFHFPSSKAKQEALESATRSAAENYKYYIANVLVDERLEELNARVERKGKARISREVEEQDVYSREFLLQRLRPHAEISVEIPGLNRRVLGMRILKSVAEYPRVQFWIPAASWASPSYPSAPWAAPC